MLNNHLLVGNPNPFPPSKKLSQSKHLIEKVYQTSKDSASIFLLS
jgi:hypothetical protein